MDVFLVITLVVVGYVLGMLTVTCFMVRNNRAHLAFTLVFIVGIIISTLRVIEAWK